MGLTQYVQHISGQGKQWALAPTHPNDVVDGPAWEVDAEVKGMPGVMYTYLLPRSEYHLCE